MRFVMQPCANMSILRWLRQVAFLIRRQRFDLTDTASDAAKYAQRGNERVCAKRALGPSITKDKLNMYDRSLLCLVTLGASLCLPLGASAQDATKYPNWSGHWRSGPPNRWDPTK